MSRRRRGLGRRAFGALLRLGGLALAAAILLVAGYRWIDPPTTLLIERERGRLGAVVREWRALDALPPHLARAVVAAEDARFCDHWGLDVDAIRQALRERIERGRRRGASTITQQVAKNVFLWPEPSWLRKALEVPLAIGLETLWGKRRILEVYLNVAEWSEGAFGAEAAARRWFSKPAAELTLAEASRLAAILPNPRARSASRPSAFVADRARAAAAGARALAAEGRDRCFAEPREGGA